jgi:hypothetical protein
MSKTPLFITGNQNKVDYLARILGVPLEHHELYSDAIFEPEGYDGLTRAELSPEKDTESYEKIRDYESLRKFLRD